MSMRRGPLTDTSEQEAGGGAIAPATTTNTSPQAQVAATSEFNSGSTSNSHFACQGFSGLEMLRNFGGLLQLRVHAVFQALLFQGQRIVLRF